MSAHLDYLRDYGHCKKSDNRDTLFIDTEYLALNRRFARKALMARCALVVGIVLVIAGVWQLIPIFN